MPSIKLLDCTLRDGGFLNDWEFGYDHIINIFDRLVRAKIDIIEVGFINNARAYDKNRSIFPNGLAIDQSFEKLKSHHAMIVGMIDYGTCSIENIQPASESYMDGIRVIFKKEKMTEALAFCGELKNLGYDVFVQAVSITSYADDEFFQLIELVNELEPYGFSVVDTYGLLHKEELNHYFRLADERLQPDIRLGYHSHNNFQLAYANCISLLENPPVQRELIVDGTLYGMGKGAGNAPLELLAMYINDHIRPKYNLEHILESIATSILPLYGKNQWGYSLSFFISALQKCHPSYTSFLMAKRTLSIASIYEILGGISQDKKLSFDENHIEELYLQNQTIVCNDREDILKLSQLWAGKKILLIGSGTSIKKDNLNIQAFIDREKPVVVAVNFLPDSFDVDYLFISNSRRYVELSSKLKVLDFNLKLIGTSNITPKEKHFDFTLQFGSLMDEQAQFYDNPLILLLKLLNRIPVEKVSLAGFDGYSTSNQPDYVNPKMEYSFTKQKAVEINQDTKNSLSRLGLHIETEFITESHYQTVL
ncbi:aldolase catalytic domain-containing protein [Paenibacillus silvae]|uniref:aldolase catalytic domain-containing protein n=1 Tax=Paenibacillus silvae TaxID=1325358 RepID=UPI0025A2DFB9|nr:aldolase catalytic domain-containing protein [Paenibacillus silvae]MDM5281343.1 aldolase catalytic domain-containing protein [Paenibacillus silvae]